MNINQLEYFVAATRHASFSLAAKELYVTPQTVSKAIGDLEEELQEPLFERKGRRVEPTSFGLAFALQAQEVISGYGDLQAIAHDHPLHAADEGSIALFVASSPCRGSVLHGGDFEAFRASHPRIKLSLAYARVDMCLEALRCGFADAALIPGHLNDRRCVCLKVLSCTLRIAVARTNPLASRRCLGPEDLHGTAVAAFEDAAELCGVLMARLQDRGVQPRYVSVPDRPEDYARFLEESNGMVLVIEDPALDEQLPSAVRLPFASQHFTSLPVCLAYEKGRDNPALLSIERYLLAAS